MQRTRSIRAILLVETRLTVNMDYARSKLPPVQRIIIEDAICGKVKNGIKRSKVTSRKLCSEYKAI